MPRAGPSLYSLWSEVEFSTGTRLACRLEVVHPQRGNPWRVPVLLTRQGAEQVASILEAAHGEAWTPREEPR